MLTSERTLEYLRRIRYAALILGGTAFVYGLVIWELSPISFGTSFVAVATGASIASTIVEDIIKYRAEKERR